jgi:hypothetical protein
MDWEITQSALHRVTRNSNLYNEILLLRWSHQRMYSVLGTPRDVKNEKPFGFLCLSCREMAT